jgi:hypothetical protein
VDSVVAGTGPEISIDERAGVIEAYFQEFHDFTGHHYMAPGEGGAPGMAGASGRGSFSTIGVRAQASTTPMFRDLAPDVFWATRRLIDIVAECADAAKKPETSSAGAPQPPAGPGANVFEIPSGGNF